MSYTANTVSLAGVDTRALPQNSPSTICQGLKEEFGLENSMGKVRFSRGNLV